jgi:flagellar biosynthesis/type III secretory pathway chaperone
MTIDISALITSLNRETAALTVFIDVLRAEQGALMRGENDRVAEFSGPKANQLIELTRLGELRNHLLARAGFSADRAGMEKLLRLHGGNAALRNAWQQLLALTQTAQQANTTNGMLISARLSHTQRALGAIFSAARLPGAYGADGNTISLRTAQQLAVV